LRCYQKALDIIEHFKEKDWNSDVYKCFFTALLGLGKYKEALARFFSDSFVSEKTLSAFSKFGVPEELLEEARDLFKTRHSMLPDELVGRISALRTKMLAALKNNGK